MSFPVWIQMSVRDRTIWKWILFFCFLPRAFVMWGRFGTVPLQGIDFLLISSPSYVSVEVLCFV